MTIMDKGYSPTDLLETFLPRLSLKRLGAESEAGLVITSLPWPRTQAETITIGSRPTHTQPIGQWPDAAPNAPRRLLLIADGANDAPAELRLAADESTLASDLQLPSAEMELLERSPHKEYMWERHILRIRQGERSIGLAIGLRTRSEVHWWEACRLVVLDESEQCITIEMGGAIPVKEMSFEEFKQYPGLTNPYLHKHNWVNGRIYARLHANGVCEIYAHHINSKFFDDGQHLDDVVPVLGIVMDEDLSEVTASTVWDGSESTFAVDGVRFDFGEVARLATPQQPGSLTRDGKILVLQPYQGMELFGGSCPDQLFDDPYILHGADQRVLRGMARTLRFSLSLSDRSPRVVRYLAPAWWYGVCEEFAAESLLPVANEYDEKLNNARNWILDTIWSRGFEDGSVPRWTVHRYTDDSGRKRFEPGWEGDIPYTQFLAAWRSGDEQEYSAAMRSAYHFTDVSVDHAAKAVRMHSYPPHAFSIPMNRVLACIAAYLETGDPYLIETAEAVTANSHWTHLNSWPRMAVGRDACYVRSAVMLYRYFATDFFRRIALEGAMTAVHSQRPNGSFGDQGGGAGLHQWSGYITKPWMGLLATNGLLDYLELFPEEEVLAQCVKKFADWLMGERFDLGGHLGWTYQHDYNGTRRFYTPITDSEYDLPTKVVWHEETIGRVMLFCAKRYSAPAYLDAWAESFAGDTQNWYDHSACAALNFIPWVQAKLWNARLTADGVTIDALHFGARTPAEATIHTPDGEAHAFWDPDGSAKVRSALAMVAP